MSKKKNVVKKILLGLLVLVIALIIVVIIAFELYGSVSIPDFLRPSHGPMQTIENVHNTFSFNELSDSGMPRVDIYMADDYLLSKEKYTKCTVKITKAGEYDLEEATAKIKIRGNTTAQADKKPFKIKFNEKTSLFGGGNEKSWVLLANATDLTNIHNYVSFKLYEHIAKDDKFIPMCNFVDVYINNEFQGVYNLCDQIETGDKRVNIDGKIKDTPEDTDYFIVEDHRVYYGDGEKDEGVSWFWMDKLYVPFEIKSPDVKDDDYTKEYTEYIKNYLDKTYEAINDKDFDKVKEYIDVDSFIEGHLIALITKNIDMGKGSMYFYLPAGGKLTYGPVWDMDLTFGYGGKSESEDGIFEKTFMYNQLFKRLMKIPEFEEMFKKRYSEISGELEAFIDKTIDEISQKYHDEFVNEFEFRKDWGRFGNDEANAANSFDEQIEYMKKWTKERIDFLNGEYND